MRSLCVGLPLLLVAGCSFSGSAGGATDDVPDAATGNAVDAANVGLDAVASDPDRDADGVLNDADNCPDTANAAQENEDLDAHGNACDVCPHLVDDGQADDDADGVGNACDPQPALANTWLYFEGFDAALDGDDWVGEGGYTVSGGELHSINNANRYYLRNVTATHGDDALIVARMSFDNPLGPNGVNFRFGGPIGRASANNNNNGCWVIRALTDGVEGYAFVTSVNGGVNGTSFTAETLANVDYEVRMTVSDTDYECDYLPDGLAATKLTRTTTTNQGGDRLGVVSSYIETHVRYLYAISLQ